MSTFRQGEQFGGFRVVSPLPTGEFGETWLCEHPITGRKAVLKGLKKEVFESTHRLIAGLDLRKRTREEAQIVAALGDRRFTFAPILYDALELDDGRVFFLTEYVKGRMLRDWLQDRSHALSQRCTILVQLLHAVNLLHGVGIVHRDLAGDNIVIGEDSQPRILDFGLAKIKSEILLAKSSADTAMPFTKEKYTPPWVFEARRQGRPVNTTESWDLYALGVLFFEIIRGALVGAPAIDVTDAVLEKTSCKNTIRELLNHGGENYSRSGGDIAITLNRELRELAIDVRLPEGEIAQGLIRSLRAEIEALSHDLTARRGKTEFADLIGYLQRTGLVYTVYPKRKLISIVMNRGDGTQITIAIDASDDTIVKFETLGLWKGKRVTDRVLRMINALNKNLEIGKITCDLQDCEIGMSLRIPHLHYAIPYEEFAAQLQAFLQGAELVQRAFERMKTSASTEVEIIKCILNEQRLNPTPPVEREHEAPKLEA